MFSSRAVVVLFLAFFLAFTSARPVRRSACRAPASATATPSGLALPIVKATSTTASDPTTTASATATSKATTTAKASSSTKVSASSSAAPAQDTPAPVSVTGLLGKLFPVADTIKSWTTSPSSNALSLSDATFRPFSVLKALSHTYTKAPDGKAAMKAHYPKGSYTFGHDPQGGFSFYAPGPSSVDLTTAKEATFGYSVFFPEGFNFQLGGKLPGLYGGNSDAESLSCSGGRRSSACFSARLMWRSKGAGEFYTYLDPSASANKKVCNVAPFSECNPTYGASVGRGAFTFATGAWTTISERVRLNDAGQANGEIELFANGKSVISVKGLVLRDSSAGRIRGMQMQTFFGGSSTQFASPKDQDVYFSDFSVSITEKL
ncbi:hypothetical protein BDN70DRAFT_931348 [Pholiota conissans]|uniref:Polysaccharide lyase 14 domain-containing protein n=1 Tax=Pholiota conissans TaxID=109636 RepID=A0A9P5Z3Q5_9AGAR|nr:hypothetical protein BDN70DRAFT_931348 [Pholiota conissans]